MRMIGGELSQWEESWAQMQVVYNACRSINASFSILLLILNQSRVVSRRKLLELRDPLWVFHFKEFSAYLINATVIVTCKKAPRALNSVRLRSFCATTQTTEPSVDLIQGFETTSVNVRSRLIEVENAHTITQKLPRSLHIAIGCRISLTNKIKTELGLINSAQGSVADILLVPGTTTYASPLTSIVRRRSRLAIPTTGALCRMPFTIFNHHPVNGIRSPFDAILLRLTSLGGLWILRDSDSSNLKVPMPISLSQELVRLAALDLFVSL